MIETSGPRADWIAAERRRVRAEYQRRARDIDHVRYASWQPAVRLEHGARVRTASRLLGSAGLCPASGDQCLEIGYGSRGWLPDLLAWGVREADLHGIEMDEHRAARAREMLPAADLRIGDATALPWTDGVFRFVVISTVLSSILDPRVRLLIAREAARVTRPGGAVICYDLQVNNPANRQVRRVGRRELRRLFPGFRSECRSCTLAPPLARLIAPRSWRLARMLDRLPFLRTHLVAVLQKS